MSSPYSWRNDCPPPPVDLSTPQQLHPESDRGVTQQDMNNRRLNQAVNYLVQKGGCDSPATFVDHVERIDKDLLQLLSQQRSAYDLELYRRVQTLVYEEQRNSSHAIQSDTTLVDSDEDVMDYDIPSPADALYRKGDLADASTVPKAKEQLTMKSLKPKDDPPVKSQKPLPREDMGASSHKHRNNRDTKRQRERQFKYGGPGNENENWYANSPASLPFPETFLMQDWESLKIHYDLARAATQDPKKSTAVHQNDIPFERVHRTRDNVSHHCESGSRFKLPVLDANVCAILDKAEVDQRLRKIIEDFNKGDKSVTEDHAPRVFLEKFELPPKVAKTHGEPDDVQSGGNMAGTASPAVIRQAMNTTPSKSRPGKNSTLNLNTLERSASVTPQRASAAGRRIKRVVDASYNADV